MALKPDILLIACGRIGGLGKLGYSLGDIGTGTDRLQHIPPGGTSLSPARCDLIIVAEVLHQSAVLAHDLIIRIKTCQIRAFNGIAYREVGGGCNRLRGALCAVGHVLDKGLRCGDSAFVTVIKDAEAPDTAAKLRAFTLLSREGHEHDLVTIVGQARIVVVCIQLLGNVPAESHIQHTLTEEVDLIAAHQRSVKIDALAVVKGLDGLDILLGVRSVDGMIRIGEGTAVKIVDNGTGALVAALACAVDGAYGRAGIGMDSVDGVKESLGGLPGMSLLVNLLHGIGGLKHGLIDGHAVGGHADRILIHSTLVVDAGG